MTIAMSLPPGEVSAVLTYRQHASPLTSPRRHDPRDAILMHRHREGNGREAMLVPHVGVAKTVTRVRREEAERTATTLRRDRNVQVPIDLQ